MSNDPLLFGAGDVNLARFVGNDPVNGVDPSGLDEEGVVGLSLGNLYFDRKDQHYDLITNTYGVDMTITFIPKEEKCGGSCDDVRFEQWVKSSRPGVSTPIPNKWFKDNAGDPNRVWFDTDQNRKIWEWEFGMHGPKIPVDKIIEYGGAFMNDRPGRRGDATWDARTKVICIKDGKATSIGEISWGFELKNNEVYNAYTK